MQCVPTPVAQILAIVVIEVAALADERVLLWSLRLDTAVTAQPPRAAVVYGRARWIGPPMEGDEIAEPNLAGVLSIIAFSTGLFLL